MNLEALRRKRAKRMGLKISSLGGQKRIMSVMDRSTRKFHGDVGLWVQYIHFAKKQQAHKKVSQILARVLRLHPNKSELWITAANYAMDDQGDMTAARGYMQRGLRFCKESRGLWLQYAKLEMIYIAKIVKRQKILGLHDQRPEHSSEAIRDGDTIDHIVLPTVTAEEIEPSVKDKVEVDPHALQHLKSIPAVAGAIPNAIFDAAMTHFQDAELGGRFFDMVAEFKDLPCLSEILQHIADELIAIAPTSPFSWRCYIQQPVVDARPTSSSFPKALGVMLNRLKTARESSNPVRLLPLILNWLPQFLDDGNLDEDIRKVLIASIDRLVRQYREAVMTKGGPSGNDLVKILASLQGDVLKDIRVETLSWSISTWPTDPNLLALRDAPSLLKMKPND